MPPGFACGVVGELGVVGVVGVVGGAGVEAAFTTTVTDFDTLPDAFRAVNVYVVVAAGLIVIGGFMVRAPDEEPFDTVSDVAPLTLQETDVLLPGVMVEGVAVRAEITGTDAACNVNTDALNKNKEEVVANSFFNDDP